jgi:carbonic anhydrase/acetyltransferase-like protein (isoleucine patch superfamily)
VVVHVARHSLTSAPTGGPKPTVIGSAVTIGHGATLHACTIGDGCLVRVIHTSSIRMTVFDCKHRLNNAALGGKLSAGIGN